VPGNLQNSKCPTPLSSFHSSSPVLYFPSYGGWRERERKRKVLKKRGTKSSVVSRDERKSKVMRRKREREREREQSHWNMSTKTEKIALFM
jgi:hypothetical protein